MKVTKKLLWVIIFLAVATTFSFHEKHYAVNLYVQRVTIADGGTAVVNPSVSDILVIVDNAAAIATATIPFPSAPVDGQEFSITTRSDISSLTLSLNSIPMSGAITSLSAGGVAKWIYSQSGNRWFRWGVPGLTPNGNGSGLTGITATQVGLGNVTNESKATMFANPTFTGTVSGITSFMVGLGNVNNTSDASKPISTATQSALDTKQATLVSGTTIKTINGASVMGSGDLVVAGAAAFSSITGVYTENASLVTGFAGKQDFLGRKVVANWQPAGNSTTITAVGAAALTATGTATAASVGSTNKHSWSKRLEYLVTVAATNAVAGWRYASAQYALGNAAGVGGFTYVCRFGPATGVSTATSRLFVGMANTTSAPTDVEPSTQVSMFGVGYDAADANIQFMHNDGSGTATKVNLGASFPVPTADRSEIYELYLFCAPNSTTVSYEFTNLSNGVTISGSVSTDLPAGNTLLAPRGWMSVGGSNSVIGIALMNLYIQTNY